MTDPWTRRRRAATEREVRQRMWRMRRRKHPGPPWRRGRGFGCLAGIVFLIVASSLFFAVGSLLARLGPARTVIAVGFAIAIVIVIGRNLGGAARALDRIVDAVERIEVGDYSARVGHPETGLFAVRRLAAGFDTMAERLEIAEQQHRTLLADVSHELRTPLAVISGNLEAIIDGVYPADEVHLSPILDETKVMERLIEDLRTIALTDAGTLTLHPEPVDPDVLVAEVVASFGPAADSAGVSLRADTADDLPIIELDPVRIREVLVNLVGNALRHTPRDGSVTLGGSALEDTLILTVADTGPGIDEAVLPHVFDRFVKGAQSGGSGLGLAISRALVEAHGGSIAVASAPERGTTFTVRLPRT